MAYNCHITTFVVLDKTFTFGFDSGCCGLSPLDFTSFRAKNYKENQKSINLVPTRSLSLLCCVVDSAKDQKNQTSHEKTIFFTPPHLYPNFL